MVVDKSVVSIHATIFSCLRRREAGEHLYDQATNTVEVAYEEYHSVCAANSLSSRVCINLYRDKAPFGVLWHSLIQTDLWKRRGQSIWYIEMVNRFWTIETTVVLGVQCMDLC